MALKINPNNPLARHYDKVIAVAALAFLSLSLVYLTNAGTTRKKNEAAYIDQLERLRPASGDMQAISLAGYENAVRAVRAPVQLDRADAMQVGFLTPERRVTCVVADCQKPIPYAAESCPFCGGKQPIPPESDPGLDSDGDGIPDKIENQWGLNPNDASDAKGDLDGDGFTNLEEYLAKTGPRDPKSHPAVVSLLRVKELRGKHMPLVFSGVNRMPDGKLQLVFNQTAPQARTHWVREGEAIGESGWSAVGKVEVKFEERDDPTMPGGKRRVDVSTAEVKRLSDNKTVTLRIGETGKNTDIEAVLLLPLDNAEYTVLEGGTFKVREETFQVVSIDSGKTSVTIENKANGLQKVIPKLD
ncbi:MAG: hypothetical protein PHU80_03985 [Kiritimatiellae bacterium]|nr:hypothetical protein [Kiritimatiellia bacterium]